jgi:hypothetical protein
MLLYLKTKKELSLPKSSAELLYQTCYVVLNHYLPNIYKTLKPELREGSDVLKTIPAHTKDQEFHKEWNMSREKFYLQFLKFIRYLNELDPGTLSFLVKLIFLIFIRSYDFEFVSFFIRIF